MPKVTDKELEQLEKMKKRQEKQNAYLKDKYDRLNITVDKGYKSVVEAAAKAGGVSVNEFCRNAIIKAVNKAEQKRSGLSATVPDELPFTDKAPFED